MKDRSGKPERELDDADAAAFREAMRGVRPLRAKGRLPRVRPKPKPRARFARADRVAVLAESIADSRRTARPVGGHTPPAPGDGLEYRRPEVPANVLRKLRRGEYRVDGELDLHGLNAVQAEQLLVQSLALAMARGDRCLRIVHGKGLRSGHGGPVLRNLVDELLRRVDAVLAFATAREVDGGAGASLVLLRAPKAAR